MAGDEQEIDLGILPGGPAALGAALSGDLPCVQCGYELRGLTVRGQCPECGTPIRVTLLYAVDPDADAFRPIPRPKVIGTVLVALMTCLTLASVLAWVSLGATAAARTWLDPQWWTTARVAAGGGVLALAMCAPLALALLPAAKPGHRRYIIGAAGACLAMTVAVAAVIVPDAANLRANAPYFDGPPGGDRLAARAVAGAACLGILLCLRPLLIELRTRSTLLRTGRVMPQRHSALFGAIGASIASDGLRGLALAGMGPAEMLDLIGSVLALVASALLVLGLGGLLRNVVVIRKVLARPPRTIDDLTVDRPAPKPR